MLLAPSLWQEACPLVVTEAMLRAIPVVSSDVFGLPEANRNARLVVPTALAYDHARGTLHHGTTNDALEATLGADPPLPSALARGRAAAAAADAEATADEVAPYAALLTALLAPDGERLRRESAASRAAAVDFVATRAGGLRALLAPLVDEAALPPEGGGGGVIGALRAAGRKVVNVARDDLVPPQRSDCLLYTSPSPRD